MKIIADIIVIFTLFIIYFIIYKLFVTLFVITGLSREKARLQVVGLLTLSGYTTKESELVVGDRLRRKLAIICQWCGIVMTTLITALIICIVSALDFSVEDNHYLRNILITFFSSLGALIALILLTRVKALKGFFYGVLEKILYGNKIKNGNAIVFGEEKYKKVFATVYINRVPEIMKDKTLSEINFDAVSIMVLNVNFNNVDGTADVDDVVLKRGYKLEVYGDPESIKKVFALR